MDGGARALLAEPLPSAAGAVGEARGHLPGNAALRARHHHLVPRAPTEIGSKYIGGSDVRTTQAADGSTQLENAGSPSPGGPPAVWSVRDMADAALVVLSPTFDAMHSVAGRLSIPPEKLLKASLLMAFYPVRSERLFCEQLAYNMLRWWFLDMRVEDASFDHNTFSLSRDRLLPYDIVRRFFRRSFPRLKARGSFRWSAYVRRTVLRIERQDGLSISSVEQGPAIGPCVECAKSPRGIPSAWNGPCAEGARASPPHPTCGGPCRPGRETDSPSLRRGRPRALAYRRCRSRASRCGGAHG